MLLSREEQLTLELERLRVENDQLKRQLSFTTPNSEHFDYIPCVSTQACTGWRREVNRLTIERDAARQEIAVYREMMAATIQHFLKP